MSRRSHSPQTLVPLYILTAADGYTTACSAERGPLLETLSRGRRGYPLDAPVTVSHWTPVGDAVRSADWKLLDKWVWGSEDLGPQD